MLKSVLLSVILTFTVAHSWGFVDYVVDEATDTWDEVTATDTWNALASAATDAWEETKDFVVAISKSPVVAEVIDALERVVEVAIYEIEEAVGDFNHTTWKKLVKDARYVIVNLPSIAQEYIAKGCNFFAELAEVDFLPFPLDVMEQDDFSTVAECLGDTIFDLASEWTKDVATVFTSINTGGIENVNFTPLLNLEPIKEDLNASYACLFNLARSIELRKVESLNTDTKVKEALDFFHYENLTISLEISFTGCTVTCGTASLGFAVNTKDRNIAKPYYTISMGIDSSTVVGAAFGVNLNFYQSMDRVTGSGHLVSFGAGINLPLIPDIIPDVKVQFDADGDTAGRFKRFTLNSDILDFLFGLSSVFSLGYDFTETKWVYSTNDLAAAWGGVEQVIQDRKDTVNDIYDAYKELTSGALQHGGYVATAQAAMTTAAAEESSAASSLVSSSANPAEATLYCPSGISENNADNQHIGDLSVFPLGSISVFEVVYGNISGTNNCNGTKAYKAVKDLCEHSSVCKMAIDPSVLGNLYCDVTDIGLTVIYGCPDQVDVFNLGCFGVDFKTVIDNGWYQDYSNDILDDGWEDRKNGLAKCAKIAKAKGLHGFATYNNGMCLMADDLFEEGVYNALGRLNQTECPQNGLGNDVALNLYSFGNGDMAFQDLGCLNQTIIHGYDQQLEQSFTSFEGEHFMFQDNYTTRGNPVSKCAQLALHKGYKGFALFDGGKCFVSNSFREEVVGAIRGHAGEDNSTQMSCGAGTSAAYNVYQFPYLDYEDAVNEDQLTMLQIGLIIGGAVAFVLLIALTVFLVIKCKNKSARGSGYSREYEMMAK